MECGHWGALPADALRHMYGLLPDAVSRAACRLVCTHWNQVADDSWQCWQFLTVRSKPAKRGALACLGIFPPTPEQLASLLSRQRPHLRRLQLEQGAVGGAGIEAAEALAPALVAACGPGSGITDLTLTVQLPLPTCVLEAIPGSAAQLTALTFRPPHGSSKGKLDWSQFGDSLSQLSSLSVSSDYRHAGPATSLSALTGLTRLRLHNMGYLPVGVAGALLQLSSLKRLDVEVALLSGRDHGGQGPPDHPGQDLPGFEGPPAWPPHLPHAQPEAGSDLKGPPAMDDGPDSSDSDDEDDDDEPPGMLTEGEDTEEEEEEADGGDDGRLAASLAPLWAGLEHLSLRSVKADDSVLAVLPTLPCLTYLQLHFCPMSIYVNVAQQCSRLQELVLSRVVQTRLPPLQAGMLPQLTRLKLSGSSRLKTVHPSWCTLPSLLSLEVESCERLELPAELSELSRLERLSCSHQKLEAIPEQVTGLSCLTRLALSACSLGELAPGPYLRGLRELVLFANNLRQAGCVPPALAHPEWGATVLRHLDLSSNYNHQLSDADVQLLGGLPCLTSLNLRRQQYEAGDAHPAEALGALRAALPRCEVTL